jgi:hypothetical protein
MVIIGKYYKSELVVMNYKDIVFLFFKVRFSYFEQCFSLWEATGKDKRKTDRSLKFTTEVMHNVNRRPRAGESKRSIDEDLGVPESTLRKRSKLWTVPTSLGRFKATFSNQEEKELADYCRDLDARFCGVTIRMLKELRLWVRWP